MELDTWPEFIDFDTEEGMRLLEEMENHPEEIITYQDESLC